MTLVSSLSWTDKDLGLYLHIPFCRVRCAYCDFATDLEKTGERQLFLKSLTEEIERLPKSTQPLRSIYFGGGTPSLLTVAEISQIFSVISKNYSLDKNTEISLEANPEGLNEDKLAGYMQAGVNRISIGIQSLNGPELKFLARGHLLEENLRALEMLKDKGINYNLDLMIGIPKQDQNSFMRTLIQVLAYRPAHISSYLLSIEEDAPWFEQVKSGKIKVADDDLMATLYQQMQFFLSDQGYKQYEISAFSLPGKECIHNLGYWKHQNWIGAGPSAASWLAPLRWQNPSGFKEWINCQKFPDKGPEYTTLSQADSVLEKIMLQFRLLEGIPVQVYTNLHCIYPELELGSRMQRLIQLELVEVTQTHYRIPATAVLLSNRVFQEYLS